MTSARPGGLRTLRGRSVAMMSGLLLAAVTVFGIVSVAILRQNLVTQAESTLYLANDTAIGQTLSAVDATGSVPTFDDVSLAVPSDGFFFVVEGDRVAVSAFFTRDYTYRPMTERELTHVRDGMAESGYTTTIDVADDGGYLVTASEVAAADGQELTVVSGVGLTETERVVGTYALWLAVVGITIAAFAAVFGWRWTRQQLDPLERVAEIADEVTATPLSSGEIAPQRRVPRDVRHLGSETDRVADALNRLLDHVELSLNARHRAEESMRRFIAEASHELRNPLASIRGYADFYAHPDADADPRETQGALQRIGSEASRMSTLIDDLLLLARLDADPVVAHDDVELSMIVAETASDARFAYPGHVWRIALPDEDVSVVGDEGAIRQMLLNLVANAGHHTPDGTSVTVSLETTATSVELVVQDDGPGIDPEALPTIFDRFTQAGSRTQTRERTTVGLGLAIVQALATASGYDVSVASSSTGTRFGIRIPSNAA
ncbi:HAMP domain-containing sensor histidine kinase [Microbacterium sp. NE2HP2]|uniref:sensor histidine kinase n=1 Tax=Microbacterium plantarum TaxID=1816425 RepID=UPI002365F7B9|nr:HAMP domain-containing sensor histidine kinase [Microbacterium plantarum]MDD7943257.1 HAMP domain-containing sensor histidine kinase [Microbacterium plantarum]